MAAKKKTSKRAEKEERIGGHGRLRLMEAIGLDLLTPPQIREWIEDTRIDMEHVLEFFKNVDVSMNDSRAIAQADRFFKSKMTTMGKLNSMTATIVHLTGAIAMIDSWNEQVQLHEVRMRRYRTRR